MSKTARNYKTAAEKKNKQKQTTASVIQQQQNINPPKWVTKYILLTLLYSAKPKEKCEYQTRAKQTETRVTAAVLKK